MWSVLSLSCLWFVVALCFLGAFHQWYDDNLLQRMGMGFVAVGYGAFLFDQVDYLPMAHVGMALFAAGTALKVWTYNRPPRPPRSQPRHHPRVG